MTRTTIAILAIFCSASAASSAQTAPKAAPATAIATLAPSQAAYGTALDKCLTRPAHAGHGCYVFIEEGKAKGYCPRLAVDEAAQKIAAACHKEAVAAVTPARWTPTAKK